jgi:hypothetical protein
VPFGESYQFARAAKKQLACDLGTEYEYLSREPPSGKSVPRNLTGLPDRGEG